MFTRDTSALYHAYLPQPVGYVVRNGAVRVSSSRGIVQTWAVSRPTASFDPVGAPFYLADNEQQSEPMYSGGMQSLMLPRMRVETDLTDKRTWQRPYRFT